MLMPVIEEDESLASAEVEMPDVIQADHATQQPRWSSLTEKRLKGFTFFDRCNHDRASVKKF